MPAYSVFEIKNYEGKNMSKHITLTDAPKGSRCMICGIEETLSVKQRLAELGFTNGALVDKLYTGSKGSPIAFRVSGAVIAVRSDDAKKIIAEI